MSRTAAIVVLAGLAQQASAQENPDKGIFVRWGATVCPAGTTTLYNGIASGAHYTHWGSGANTLCLHGNSQPLSGSNTRNNDGGLLYGTEYQNSGRIDKHHDRDAACAVCQVDTPGEVYVQWGRANSCSNNHKTLYNGFVMANHYTQRRSTFVCVDPERAYHERQWSGNQDGNLWYTTETEGGAIDETLYPQDVEVGCSVCLAPRETYVRWGAKACSKGSSLVYTGIAAGGMYYHNGGGHNTLCLHSDPQYPLGAIGSGNQNGALLYGVEYQNTGAIDANYNKDAACAVCMPDEVGDVYVQWGRSTACDHDHTTLYSGFVMAERYTHRKSEFVCVDPAREFHSRSSNSDHNGALWYTTEAEQGSIDETQYKHNVEIGCSVCLAKKSTYVNWGAKACPKGKGKLLYSNFAASGHYSHRGSGANALCMHPKPQTPKGASAGNQNGALLYGTEYQNTGTLDKNHDKDAACAVCELEKAGNVYVQWGRSKSCSNNHETLYTGYIMSNHYSQNKNEFVCVNPLREFHARSSNSDHNGNLWYTVEVEGGSMDEAIYQHNREIGCAVCRADAADIAPTPPPTPSFDKQAPFTQLVTRVTNLEKAQSTMQSSINTMKTETNNRFGSVEKTIQDSNTAMGALKNELNAALANEMESIKGAFAAGVESGLAEPAGYDFDAMCNGKADPEACAEVDCSDADAGATCPVTCGTCQEIRHKPMLQTAEGTLNIKLNKGEKLSIDNGMSDVVMTATEVKALVEETVKNAFTSAHQEL